MPQIVSLSAKAEPFTPTGPSQQQPKVDVRAGWGQQAGSEAGQAPSTAGRSGWGQAPGTGPGQPPQQSQGAAPYSIPHPQFTDPHFSPYQQPPSVQYQGHFPAPGFMAPHQAQARPSAHPNVRQEIMAPPMMGAPPPGEFMRVPYPMLGAQPLGPPPPGMQPGVAGLLIPPVSVAPVKEEEPPAQQPKKKAYVPKALTGLKKETKKKEPTKEKEAAPVPAPAPVPVRAPAPAPAAQRIRGSYKPPSKREDGPVPEEPEEQAPPEPPVVNEPTPARVTIKQDGLNPDIDVVTFELEYADEPLGLVFLQQDAAVVLRRVTRDSPGAKLENFVGRNVVAVTAKAQTYTVHHQSDISDAIRGEKHIILQFRKGPARPEAPRVPQSVPIRNIQANMLDLKKRLMPKAGSLIQELDVICDIAVTGAPERVAETTKAIVFRAWQESSASRTGADKPEARAEREIYKRLFKALGWDDVPVAVPPSDLCVLVSAQLFLQRKDKDDECNAVLKSALGITTSDEDFALIVKKREEEQRIRDEKILREKEENLKRMAAAKERMRSKAAVAVPSEPVSSAGSVDVKDSIRAAMREPGLREPAAEALAAPVRTTPLYPLSREWKMWHNRPGGHSAAPKSSTEDGEASYAKGLNQIPAEISELGEFWQVLSHVPKPASLPVGDSLALFRRNTDGSFVRPLWEDAANKTGGEWRARLRDDEHCSNAAWIRAACHLVSGSMPNNGIVCGISVERRKGGDRLGIWVDNIEEDSVTEVGEAVKAAIADLRATDLQGKPQPITFTFHAEDLQGRTAADRQRRYEIA